MRRVTHSRLPEILTEAFPPARSLTPAQSLYVTLLYANLKHAIRGYNVGYTAKIINKEKVEAPQMERYQVYGCML